MSSIAPGGITPVVETSVKVRYAETDAQRVVYHGEYVVWFEVGRTEYCEQAGYPYPRMEAEGILITVVELKVRYRKSARYGDIVTVRTRFGGQKSRGCTFFYEILLPDGSLAVEGETHHLFMDRDGRPRTVPPTIRQAFKDFSGL
ncbi:MAG: thioesterase family protein [Thermoanaerobaculia bacterium]